MRYQKEIFWKPKNNRVKFIPVLSSKFKKRQYVQDKISDYNFNFNKTIVYACGSDSMIRQLKIKMLNSGLLDKDFYSDSFIQSM
jgi:CDP-4-dehydro-6-deoxyglucose reductase